MTFFMSYSLPSALAYVHITFGGQQKVIFCVRSIITKKAVLKAEYLRNVLGTPSVKSQKSVVYFVFLLIFLFVYVNH